MANIIIINNNEINNNSIFLDDYTSHSELSESSSSFKTSETLLIRSSGNVCWR